MRKSTKISVAAVAACLIAASGSAFTAANTGVDDSKVGYDSATMTGIAVTNTQYVVDVTDGTKLSSIVFTTSTDVFTTAHTAYLNTNGAAPTACTIDSATVITCVTGVVIAGLNTIGLTVAAA